MEYRVNGYIFCKDPKENIIPIKISNDIDKIKNENALHSALDKLLEQDLISGYVYLKK